MSGPERPTLSTLEQALIEVGEDIGAPDPEALRRVTFDLVDARLEAGRRAMLDPASAELLGLDPASAHLAGAIRTEFEKLAEEPGGPKLDRQVIDTCLSAIAGGVTESSLEARFAEALTGVGRPETVLAGLDLLEASLDFVRRYHAQRAAEAAPEAEAMAASIDARWGEEPPVRVRTIAEVMLISAETATARVDRALLNGTGSEARLLEARQALLSTAGEVRALLQGAELERLAARLEPLLRESRRAAEVVAEEAPEVVPEAPSAEHQAQLRAWQDDLPELASRALYFLRTAVPRQRLVAAQRMADELHIPVPELLAAAQGAKEISPGCWRYES